MAVLLQHHYCVSWVLQLRLNGCAGTPGKESVGITQFCACAVSVLSLDAKEIGHWHLVVSLLVSNGLA